MPYAPLQPLFLNAMEIRMGSPFRCADLTLEGTWTPKLPDYDWQDVFAESDNGRFLALVAWDTTNNEPGFRIVVIDKKNKSVRISKRIAGCCKSLALKAAVVTFETFHTVPIEELADCQSFMD